MTTVPFTILKYPYDIYDVLNGVYGPVEIMSIDPSKGGSANLAIRVATYDNGYCTTKSMKKHYCDNNYESISRLLRTYDLTNVAIVLVERQLVTNGRALYQVKHILCYMCVKANAIILDVDSRLKYSWFNCPKLTPSLRKKWGTENAYEILTLRQDYYAIELIEAEEKGDDLGDTVTQEVAVLEWLIRYEGSRALARQLQVWKEES